LIFRSLGPSYRSEREQFHIEVIMVRFGDGNKSTEPCDALITLDSIQNYLE
jgi:hypothetical protein